LTGGGEQKKGGGQTRRPIASRERHKKEKKTPAGKFRRAAPEKKWEKALETTKKGKEKERTYLLVVEYDFNLDWSDALAAA